MFKEPRGIMKEPRGILRNIGSTIDPCERTQSNSRKITIGFMVEPPSSCLILDQSHIEGSMVEPPGGVGDGSKDYYVVGG